MALSEQGPLRVYELQARLAWEQSRLSHQLRRMEQRGLIAKEPGALIRVTDLGREQIAAAREAGGGVRPAPRDRGNRLRYTVPPTDCSR